MLFDKVAEMPLPQEQKNDALSRLFKAHAPFWKECQTLREEVQKELLKKQEIAGYYENTTCWKIAKPLRMAMDFLKSENWYVRENEIVRNESRNLDGSI